MPTEDSFNARLFQIQVKYPQSLFLMTVCGGILLIVTGCGSGTATATTAPGDNGQTGAQVLLDTPLSTYAGLQDARRADAVQSWFRRGIADRNWK